MLNLNVKQFNPNKTARQTEKINFKDVYKTSREVCNSMLGNNYLKLLQREIM